MKLVPVTVAWAIFVAPCYAQQPKRLLCIIEKAAGVTTIGDRAEQVARAITFQEAHRRFTIILKPVQMDQDRRNLCRQSLDHWTPSIEGRGSFDPTDAPFGGMGPGSKDLFYSRGALGQNCFASEEASIKFFDRDHTNAFYGYGNWGGEYSASPGNWIGLWDNNKFFQAGETLDAGPVVFSGSCQPFE